MGADNLVDHADDWDRLNACTVGLPILDAAFFQESLRQFGDGGETLVLGRAGGGLVAAGILIKQGAASWTTFQPSQAPMGAWLMMPHLDVVDVCSSLQHALPSLCLLLGISQQDPKYLDRPASVRGVQTLDYIKTACIPFDGTFAEYWSKRGRNLRQNLKRQRNRLTREKVEIRLEMIEDAGIIGAAVDDYGEIESKGWKGEKGTALHGTNAQGRFYRAVFERLAAKGEALVYRYWYDDNLVASDLCVRRDGILIILKTAHDEEFGKTSPTHLMRQEYFEQLFEDGGVRSVEFYGKLMDWHTKWSEDIRRMYHINSYRWPVLATIRSRLGRNRKTGN